MRGLSGKHTAGTNMLKNNKSLGQHWLKDRSILEDISEICVSTFPGGAQVTTEPERRDPVTTGVANASGKSKTPNLALEIGPGLGTLTSSLLKRFNKVIAVEYDQRLAENLPKSFPGKNLKVVNQDFLKYDLEQIKEPYVVAGNIPYYITSPIINKLLETKNHPQRIVLLIQKEVADRILALDGRESVLSLTVKNQAKVIPGFIVKKEFFTPPPKVDSAVIILEPLAKPQVSKEVIDFIKLGFKNPRKKLIKNLPYDQAVLKTAFADLKIDQNARPADLSLNMWQKLLNSLS